MKQLGVIDNYDFTPNGDLLVPIRNEPGQMGMFDVFRRDEEFLEFLYGSKIADEIERFSFADELKAAVTRIFGIDPSLYMTDEGKNSTTHIEWSKFAKFLDKPERDRLKSEGTLDRNLTVRELLQYFGTNLCRYLDTDCWVRSTWNAIGQSETKLAVIDDCRFPNEFEYFKNRGAKTVRLKRDIKKSSVISETALDNINDSEYDLVVDNSDLNMYQKNQIVVDWLISIGWLGGVISA